jgi:glutamate carboxypeptidase
MPQILEYSARRLPGIMDQIGELARIESPTEDKAAVDRAVDWVADRVSPLARVKRHRQKEFGDHLSIEFTLPGRKKEGQVLGLGHLDTVWPMGTLARMPVRVENDRLWGPGVFDMKSGVVYFIIAAEALRELDIPVKRKFVVQLNSDEEVGSPSSRPLTTAEAKRSNAVLVAEPSAALKGCAKTRRTGGGTITLRVRGRASHAGLDFEAGASAVVELSKQLITIAGWSDLKKGITINPGVISGGTRSNVVAEDAWAEVDVRVPRAADAVRIEQKFLALRPNDPRTGLTIEGGLRRPPLERSIEVLKLYRLARKLSLESGIDLCEAQVGGGSDGNFTAAMGVPTLDGLGGVGEGAHALHESILVNRIADRVTLIAKLIAAL